MNGTLFKARYVLQHLLGEGAMGQVYRAFDAHTRQTVAVKVLTRQQLDARALMRKLAHEARAVARLDHPHIVRLIDFGQGPQGRPFLVMDYLPGRSLHEWLPALSGRDLFPLFDAVLDALAYAHARGVIHRDLKPENIILVEDAQGLLHPKLVDFGIARVADGESREGRVGRVLGTPLYMPPEQGAGQTYLVGPPSDLYALGVILFQCITGHVPFSALTPMGHILAHMDRPVPQIQPRQGLLIPRHLDAIVYRLLEKSPRQRYACAAAVRRALRQLDWSVVEASTSALALEVEHTIARTIEQRPTLLGHEGAHTAERPIQETLLGDDELEPEFVSDDDHTHTLFREGVEAVEHASSGPFAASSLLEMRTRATVARHDERVTLWHALTQMLETSRPTVVALHGPSGVGKTHLARWLCERAEEEGIAQRLMGGVGPSSPMPRGGVRMFFERALSLQGVRREELEAALETLLVDPGVFAASELERLIDFLRPFSPPGPETSEAPWDPIASLVRVLRERAQTRPLILVLDELDGSPDASPNLELLERLLATRAHAPIPVLAVITYDPAVWCPSSSSDEVWKTMRSTGASWVEVAVGLMDDEDIATLAQATIPLEDNTCRRLVSESRGVPGYTVQLLTHWLSRHALVSGVEGHWQLYDLATPLPRDWGSLWQARLTSALEQVSDVALARAALVRAAVCGHHVAFWMLREALSRDGFDDALAGLDEVWDRMIAQGLWMEAHPGHVHFASEELRAVILDIMVEPVEQARLHAAFAEIKRAAADTHVVSVGELAEHYAAAGDLERACECMLGAARQAQLWGHYPDARQWFVRLRAFIAQHAMVEASAIADDIDFGLAMNALRTGQFDAVVHHLDAIRARARPDVRPYQHMRELYLRGELHRRRGELDVALSRYEDALEVALALGDLEGVAHIQRGMADVFILKLRYEEALHAARQAREQHTRSAAWFDVGQALLIEGKVVALQHAFAAAEGCYRQAREVFKMAGASHCAAEADFHLAHLDLARGRWDVALDHLRHLLQRFVDVGDQAMMAACYRGMAQVYRRRGALDDAEEALEEALALANQTGDRLGVARAHNGLGEVARLAARWQQAKVHYQAYLGVAQGLGDSLSIAIAHANLGLVHVQLEPWADAVDTFEHAVHLMRQAGHRPFLGVFLACLAHALAAAGRFDRVPAITHEVLRIDDDVTLGGHEFLTALHAIVSLMPAETDACMMRSLQERLHDKRTTVHTKASAS